MKTNLTHSEQFKILWEFLTKHGAEVEARGTDELSPEQQTALAQLASGQADRVERMKLLPLLQSNRKALAFLGEQIKVIRPSADRKRQSSRGRVH